MTRAADRRSATAGNRGRGMHWIRDEKRRRIYWRDGMACVYCGSGHNLTLDHVVARERGGSHDAENLLTACARCNEKRGTRSLIEFAFAELPNATDVLERTVDLRLAPLPPFIRPSARERLASRAPP